jgi:2-amino-4-hydroxy-6-hydroxymethyldihydropteridine diphosphokinase
MVRAFVSVGSNIGPENNVRSALHLLGEHAVVRAVSTVYVTEPIGPGNQPPFYNCVVEIETVLPPLDVKYRLLRRVEASLGRERTADRYAPRTIDLDLILYNDAVLTSDELTLPDPDILERPFLAAGLRELAPGLVLPGSGVSIEAVAARLPDETLMPLEHYTEQIRKEILHDRTK